MNTSMKRRTFIRVVGGVGLTSMVPFRYIVGAEEAARSTFGILVEAASFAKPGGWKLDTRHYQQMGGCYLLAHGIGKPVADAKTTVKIPRAGRWHVWVRTRDWCPGGRADKEIEEQAFDLVIVGGGIAGCAAALTARSKGLKVALIQDRPLFGGNCSEEVRVHTLGISGKCEELLKTIDTLPYPNGHADGIASVEAREVTTGTIRRFRAPIFIDATGDAWLGYWAGADYRYGREAHTEFNEAWEKYGDPWSPKTPDNRVLGTSVLWNCEEADEPSDFPDVPWAMPVASGHAATAGEWYWEYSAEDVHWLSTSESCLEKGRRIVTTEGTLAKYLDIGANTV